MYSKSKLEEICYFKCLRAGWVLPGLFVRVGNSVRYNESIVFKYAKSYLEKKLKENPCDRNYKREYINLMQNRCPDSETKLTINEMEKMCYEYCEKVDYEDNDLSSMDFGDIILFKDGIKKYAKRYRKKNEPEMMSLKEILFFLDEDDFFNKKLSLYYHNVVTEWFNKYVSKNNINFSFIEKHNNEILMEAMKRYCYDYCEMRNWEYNKIGKLSLKDQIYDSVMVRELAKEVMLRNEPVAMDYQKCMFFLDQKEYEFFDKYQSIASLILREHEELKSIMNYLWFKDNFKSFILKYCFDLCEKFQWNYQNINKYCDDNLINFHSLMELCMIYYQSVSQEFEKKQNKKYQDYIKLYVEQYFVSNFYLYIEMFGEFNIYDAFKFMNEYKIKRDNSNLKYVNLFGQLLKLNDQTEIAEVIQTKEQHRYLKSFLKQYVTMYWGFSNYTDDIFISLNEKLNIFRVYLSENNKLQKKVLEQQMRDEQLKCAENVIKEYLDGVYYTIEEFCQCNNISHYLFLKHLNILKDNNHQLFSLYTSKQEKLQSQRYAILIVRARQIIDLIKLGVIDNDKKRDFDLLDYYSMTKFNFDQFFNIIKDNLNSTEYRILRIFFAKYQNDKELTPHDISLIYNTKTIIGVEVDSKGRIIPDSGREVTLEEKKGIIKYLKSNHIPITSSTYNIALRRWSNGIISINSQNVNDNGNRVRKYIR